MISLERSGSEFEETDDRERGRADRRRQRRSKRDKKEDKK